MNVYSFTELFTLAKIVAKTVAIGCLARSQLQKRSDYIGLRRLVKLNGISPLQQLHAFLEAFMASFARLYKHLNKEKIESSTQMFTPLQNYLHWLNLGVKM